MISESELSILQCPVCKGDLAQDETYLTCKSCRTKFPCIDDIVVLLTKDDLSDFLSQPWGSELQKDYAGAFSGFAFVTNEHPTEDIWRLHKDATEAGRAGRLYNTGVYPEAEDLPEDIRNAVDRSRAEVVELSRARSAKRILDWPMGWGYCMQYLANQVGPETLVVALEVNFRLMAQVKPYYDKYGLSDKMLFVVADARKMPFKDGVFQAATALGGTVEIGDAEAGCKETFRVLEDNGWFGISGDQYRDGSPSMEITIKLGLDSLATEGRFEAAMKGIGFRDFGSTVLFEGYDTDTDEVPDEDRCPLPARGDWYQHIVASARK